MTFRDLFLEEMFHSRTYQSADSLLDVFQRSVEILQGRVAHLAEGIVQAEIIKANALSHEIESRHLEKKRNLEEKLLELKELRQSIIARDIDRSLKASEKEELSEATKKLAVDYTKTEQTIKGLSSSIRASIENRLSSTRATRKASEIRFARYKEKLQTHLERQVQDTSMRVAMERNAMAESLPTKEEVMNEFFNRSEAQHSLSLSENFLRDKLASQQPPRDCSS